MKMNWRKRNWIWSQKEARIFGEAKILRKAFERTTDVDASAEKLLCQHQSATFCYNSRCCYSYGFSGKKLHF